MIHTPYTLYEKTYPLPQAAPTYHSSTSVQLSKHYVPQVYSISPSLGVESLEWFWEFLLDGSEAATRYVWLAQLKC